MHENIPEQDAAGLRRFGLLMAGVLPALFGLLFPWLFDRGIPAWPWIVSGILLIWSLAHPTSLNFLYHAWMRLGLMLGWLSSRIVLGTLFFLVFTPISWILKLRGKDPLSRRFDPSASSYRLPSRTRDINHMERPF